ncbi:mannonate dehydratase [Falsiroseomonas sp. HW251]|uniref:mannonate dehydratase n=1 Tax=Falsiroseomonas sp. HW251 TaxID=3390998 RepID=UPI003D314C10
MRIADRFFLKGAFDTESLAYIRQLGAEGATINIAGELAGNREGTRAVSDALTERLRSGPYWTAEDLIELRAAFDAQGLELFAIGHVPPHRYLRALLGLPGRDEEIEHWCRSLRAMAAAGIGILQYSWHLNAGARHVNWHTDVGIPIRGGALAEGFDHALARDAPATEIGIVSDEQLWESLTYFLRAVLPVADEVGVRMALHPADPQVPSLAGIARIMRSPEAFDRLLDIHPGPSNAINFCQGCFAQMLEPEGVYRAIEHFAARGAIAFVHFRNVTGGCEKFVEAFWDEGKVDMVRAIRTYRDAGFDGYFTPDHHPHVVADTAWGHRSRGFALGYMRGLIQSTTARSWIAERHEAGRPGVP